MTDIRHVDLDNLPSLRSYIFGLAMACPVAGNPGDCPLHEIRNLPVQQKAAWAESLTREECLEIFNYHCACYDLKLKDEGRPHS